MELPQEKDFPATLTQEDFTGNLEPFPKSPELRAGRKNPLAMDETKLLPCKLGELRSAAAVSLPDIYARLARIALRVNAHCGGDVNRINKLV